MSGTLVESFGLALRQLRTERDLSQEQLAALSDLNRSYLGEIERAKVIASLATVHKLAQALGLSVTGVFLRCEQIEQQRVIRRIDLTSFSR
ncbi:helix-turn-helix transcriptional regulator [Variovorax sp. J22G73]|jgi:transcriptional regulator with XRE-family HTH domain|uniref:helix-turn-helix transcriptional regulator n=1 Tax=unclassified Variovorax TaxID=663243 RepID=UPI000D5CA944|nr:MULTISPECIES: helix-turn-helix transcriptional regulator [unclassified Variovorax]MDM0005126.1 helix-turn-helix transcriptional regulator [Variovorax sp. J22R203]MDM0098542.1 helix-turn-helix transcriptional regulator [Variovorax sp. J22G73]